MRLFLMLAICFAVMPFHCFAAQATDRTRPIKPVVKVHYDPGKIGYRHQYEDLTEACHNPMAAGCAHSQYTGYIHISSKDDETYTIDLYFVFFPFVIDISTKYQPNTCEFDQIIKHELTHVALYRKTMEKYKNVIAAEVLTVAKKNIGLSRIEFDEVIRKAFYKAFENFQKEAERQNALLDGPEHYAYQWNNCKH